MSITAAGLAGAAAISALIGGGMTAGNSAVTNARQFNYQKKLIMYQAQLQKYMAQHAHQWEVGDLRAAGLNPILSANNGATANVSGGTASSNSAMDLSMGNTIADALNTWQANKNSAQSILNQKPVQEAQENLLKEQALSEQNKRDNLDSQTKMNNLSAIGKEIENTYLPDTLKSNILYNVNGAKAAVAQAGAAQIGAHASLINATSGNPTKVISDILNNPTSYYSKIKSGAKSLNNSVRNDLMDVIKSVGPGLKGYALNAGHVYGSSVGRAFSGVLKKGAR